MSKTIKYQKVNKLSNEDFKRVTGVSKDTFALMKEVVTKHYRIARAKGGAKKAHTPSDQILMMLEYYREYRTYKHMAIDYNTSESTVHYTVKKIEEILIKDDRFHLPSLKKTRSTDESSIDIIVVDVTESLIERPKKSKDNTTLVKRNDTL
jgi:hypothetical protein